MKVFVTGANGFLGRNLTATLHQAEHMEVIQYDVDSEEGLLEQYAAECDFVFHLAGVNRPQRMEEFMEGNSGFTRQLLDMLKKHESKAPILFASSIQASLLNPYGQSKKAAEEEIFKYGKEQNVPVYVYRLPNVFGKWSRPNYNSAVATFCHNIARGLPVSLSDPDAKLHLAYVDDVVAEFMRALYGKANSGGMYCAVEPIYETTVGLVADLIESFRTDREKHIISDMGDLFAKKLYATYLSFLQDDRFEIPLKTNIDSRGSFTELFHTGDRGQYSVNIVKPGIIKGNHWHHTKNEKFVAVSGQGVIRLRKLNEHQVLTYLVSGDKPEAVDIPPGYVHSIENLGNTDMVTVIWANENFDPQKPDTYYQEV